MLLYVDGYDSTEVTDKINNDLANVNKWLSVNRFKLHVNKTKVTCIGFTNQYV